MAEWDYPKYRARPARYMHHEVILFEGQEDENDFPNRLCVPDFLEWIDQLRQSVPREYRDSVYIELGSVSGFEGSHYACVKIAYRRPETDDELKARIADFERVQHDREQFERAEFQRLRSKFAKPT